MDINLLKKWLGDLESEKQKIINKISHIKALIPMSKQDFTPKQNIFVANAMKTVSGKINKRNEIYHACGNMNDNFTANDIKTYLEQSENKEIQKIQLAYISGQLCKLVNEKKISIIKRRRGKGGGNIYSMNEDITA
jgi:hypothetical protein